MTTAPTPSAPKPATPRPPADGDPIDGLRLSNDPASTTPLGDTPLDASPYQSYVYAYPHKTAYRPLAERPVLAELWAGEPKDALSLYAHIPFCEVRCGFCNLFTRIGAPDGLTGAYLDALDRQAARVADALGPDARYAQAAFGGGTPTFLTAGELERLCDIVERRTGADLRAVPLSVEASPSTATADRLALLAARGATRLSLGVQSFVPQEARAAVRPQRRADVEAAIARVREARIPVLNLDLIYGIDGQTAASWRTSLDAALAWQPEELYLYPLYVRPLTGLGRREDPDAADPVWDGRRLALYRAGRDHLLAAGYEQVSMRMFRRASAPAAGGTEYCCQTDAMVGLGCGARSYTRALHYSFDYAVSMTEIRGIVDDYVARPAGDFDRAEVGWWMDAQEARRRHLVQSLLQCEGLAEAGYRERFGTDAAGDFAAELAALGARGWLADTPGTLRLTPEGLAHSDAIGPAFFSGRARAAMAGYRAR
ncbi:STM4012 family radical SAM protein [Streptantibioticus silvisoli]|uniref:Heme chaperone HemW n=1 Tax=Streptantibioticus silvisoli TaxID=2705255 RepID=A0ABT6W7P0_9ACTN|nr:STM4012 family radical SAM protein [Streptantibioticus silvisoli]MDI5965496.1 STM4012 family radical SAM protein [Streptantibioticus silvisoli]